MTADKRVEALIRQITELPPEAQEEVVQTLIEMHAERLGIYASDDAERPFPHLAGSASS
jgi:hypothetical protein